MRLAVLQLRSSTGKWLFDEVRPIYLSTRYHELIHKGYKLVGVEVTPE